VEQPVDPQKLMKQLTVAALCETAERYYAGLSDPTHQLSKPFGSLLEAPVLLSRIPLLLAGLRLGKSMVVLDFGAGTCWLSRLLNQLQCVTISVDVSRTALELGKRLFQMSPIIGDYVLAPTFMPFDGEHLDVQDDSVDRVVCFDTFHHVPNQRQILSEFFRVLKPGGIVGFSEPGPLHSQTPQAQYEMQRHGVLENDIRLDEIHEIASSLGFTDLRVKLVLDPSLDLGLEEYMSIISAPPARWEGRQSTPLLHRAWLAVRDLLLPGWSPCDAVACCAPGLANKILSTTARTMHSATVFFLTKGVFVADSRIPTGLHYEMTVVAADRDVRAGQLVEVTVLVKNVGQSVWLHANIQDIGVVRLGVHLFSSDRQLLDNDLARGELGQDIAPGQSATVTCRFACPSPGEYILALDLLSEHIVWFEMLGNQPHYLSIHVS